jgi:hypothetical protein
MNKYLTFDNEYDMYDIKKPVLAKFLISQGFDKRDIKQWFDDHDAYDESIINSFDDLEESTEEEIEDWAKTEMEFYSEGNDFNINENKMSKEFLHMQKLAGIITEGEYKAKMNENEEIADEVKNYFKTMIETQPEDALALIMDLVKNDGKNWGEWIDNIQADIVDTYGGDYKGSIRNYREEELNENRTAEELFQMFKDEDLLNDRREYDIEDLMSTYPDLSKEEAKKLEKMLHNI